MVRIRKNPKVRQEELIDAALELFTSVGYEKTMIIDIVQKAGVAKGTFFYYFPTKEAVLEAICMRWATTMVVSFQQESRNCTVLKKLELFILQLLLPSQVDLLIDKLWKEEKLNLIYHNWKKPVEMVFNPLLTVLCKQGNKEGAWHVEHIGETLAFFWGTMDCLLDMLYFDESNDTCLVKVKIAESVLERIFGIEEGSLHLSFPLIAGA